TPAAHRRLPALCTLEKLGCKKSGNSWASKPRPEDQGLSNNRPQAVSEVCVASFSESALPERWQDAYSFSISQRDCGQVSGASATAQREWNKNAVDGNL